MLTKFNPKNTKVKLATILFLFGNVTSKKITDEENKKN